MKMAARNTIIEERGDYNLAMEMHKVAEKSIQNRLKQSEIMRKHLTEHWLHGSKINEKNEMIYCSILPFTW